MHHLRTVHRYCCGPGLPALKAPERFNGKQNLSIHQSPSSSMSLEKNSSFTLPKFDLECGITLPSVNVSYKTWGTLNAERNNVMVICHPFTGCADVGKWWSSLMGCGKAFDPRRMFIFCANALGSPFGTTSPLSINPSTGRPYGPDFPPTTIRDDVRLHKLVLDHIGITSIAVLIGGSMGGMAVLEWQLCFPGFIRRAIAMATCAKQSAWCIAWGEVKRQIIFTDAAFKGGYYSPDCPPTQGLATARMAGLLTYRSSESYEERFGRRTQEICRSISYQDENDACPKAGRAVDSQAVEYPLYAAQSYLRYKGSTFAANFDTNCYLHIMRKMDTHDITRGRVVDFLDEDTALAAVLGSMPARPLIISINSDVLCPPKEQKQLADGIPEAELVTISSVAGHDGFLVESERINTAVLKYLQHEFPEFY
ncbi:Homoserine O-acetyltransferase [Mycena venus]|uniref:Homoserine O-acetyltransferase n=1 Tax=Mycena venus TaxID=2733690 RepID=A0A8H6XL24_9AGAR|nr:Homoserine O-acetyltransferase [Mycena venus]